MEQNSRKAWKGQGIRVSELNGVRSLHLGNSMVQSAMRVALPTQLELAYTRCMMGVLLFHPSPENILMIGLGGGSLAKFVYDRLPRVKTCVIEINSGVVATAHDHFFLPPEDERLHIIIGDGGEYVANHPRTADILMVDGFDGACQVASLCTQDFYNNARSVLRKNGVLVVNLLSRDRGFQNYMKRIESSFSGNLATLLVEPGNQIVFAFKRQPGMRIWNRLNERAKELEDRFSLPFTDFSKKLYHQRFG